jgi:hypothetical protein
MILHVVAVPADIVVAASMIEAGTDRDEFRDSRPECYASPGEHDGHAKKVQEVGMTSH